MRAGQIGTGHTGAGQTGAGQTGATRALLALVIVMGVLILAGTAGLVAVVVHPQAHPARVAHASGPVPSSQAALRPEPAGTRITAMTRQSDTVLAIALSGGGPDRVLVWDLLAGRAVAEIRLGP